MRITLCGTPHEHCTGAIVSVSVSLGKAIKAHASRSDAVKCHIRYLIRVLGYTQVGPREFSPPDGGPVLVLSKKCRFGGSLRGGKQNTRKMPYGRFTGGLIY